MCNAFEASCLVGTSQQACCKDAKGARDSGMSVQGVYCVGVFTSGPVRIDLEAAHSRGELRSMLLLQHGRRLLNTAMQRLSYMI